MKYFLVVCLLALANQVRAQSCIEINDEKARLVCFDAAVECTRLPSASARLSCFDQTYSHSEVLAEETVDRSLDQPLDQQVDQQVDQQEDRPVKRPDRVVSEVIPQVEVTVSKEKSEGDQSRAAVAKDFGRKKTSKEPVEYIEGEIVDVMKNARRIDYIRLDNGQIWRENKDNRVKFKIGQHVRVEKGVLNSFDLRVPGVKKLIKVRRVN